MRSSFCTLNKKTNMWYVYCQWLYVVDLSSGDNNKLLRNYCLNFLLYSVCARVIPHTQADSLCPMYECVCERGGETNAFLCVNLREGVSARDLLFAIERESVCVHAYRSVCVCASIHVCVGVYIPVYAYLSVYVYLSGCTCIPVCACMYTCLCVWACILVCVCVCIPLCVCACMHISVCMHAYISLCVCIPVCVHAYISLCVHTCVCIHTCVCVCVCKMNAPQQ